MASALDDDTQRAVGRATATGRAMLRSVQKDLQKIIIVLLLGFVATFYSLRLYIWDFLRGVTKSRMRAEVGDSFEIIAQTPFDVILLQAKIGLVAGIIAAIPALLYFSRDALRERGVWPEVSGARWKLALVGGFAAVLFIGGAAYGYAVFFPVMFGFLAEFGFDAGFAPRYSIVLWTEFIVLLTLSFGLAAQMPLAITGLSYAEIVPYETFRDKWRHAVVGIFIFGAVFSPPDPFTQIMWAIPLVVLYGMSLYLAKVVVTARRGSEQIRVLATARQHWNRLLGIGVVGGVGPYVCYRYGGIEATNWLLAFAGSRYRLSAAGETLGVAPDVALGLYGAVVAVAFVTLGLAYFVYSGLDPDPNNEFGDPTAIDLSTLDAAGVRAAPPEAFAELSEEDATQHASDAIEQGDKQKARAILDRFDETEASQTGDTAGTADEDGDDGDDGDASAGEPSLGDRASRASDSFLDELTDGEQDTDDIGGYYTDVAFVAGSLRSKSFRIVATFMLAMGAAFTWFYIGGLGAVRENFLSRLPAELVDAETLTVITLHPVEAILFIVKFSVLIGAIAVIPVIAYYAWPALRELGVVRGHQRVVFLWTGSLTLGLLGGFALGYLYIAPAVIAYLVNNAQAADMLITYRINDFFWLIAFTTAGIGLLTDIPILMLLLNRAGIPYQSMRGRWREVTIALLTLAAVFTPADVMTMFLVTIPLMAAYGIGLGVLFLITAGGRRNLAPPSEFVT
jgi:sec-independent protein translocase protein TatC